ncbi:MAG: dUTP diphosphatase [Candidatus Cloacimonetes bacterium]|jgi:dUTP pyrophosphatase|nr:dUTP diphosphatase [Candidatus Cloacimonadota bacterium]MBT7468843.1 dUTP diphosphatase [Candidatus Cloacimonadota bacterium]
MKIKIQKITKNALLPQKMTEHAAGYDLYSANDENIMLKPSSITLVSTGIAISLPIGYEAQIRPRSGLAVKNQIGILNSPGTIDADYRGEIKVILFNFGKTNFTIKPAMRIAQMVISKHETIEFELHKQLDETRRGDGGFGHTK